MYPPLVSPVGLGAEDVPSPILIPQVEGRDFSLQHPAKVIRHVLQDVLGLVQILAAQVGTNVEEKVELDLRREVLDEEPQPLGQHVECIIVVSQKYPRPSRTQTDSAERPA